MRNFSPKLKRALVATCTLASLVNFAIPVLADDTTITSSGQVFSGTASSYGAYVNSMSNATITTNDTKATVTTVGNGSALNWQYLNVGAGKTLDYNFTAAGQVSINSVVNGLSKFAGNITTSGEQGRVIISNPNGMLFENGSFVNANALTLTTKNVMWDGNLNGQIQLLNNNSTGTITFGNNSTINTNAPVIQVAEDLNIVAPNIVINGADIRTDIGKNGDLLSTSNGGSIRLITTDGVTFFAAAAVPAGGEKFATSTNPANTANFGDIVIKKANLSVQDNSTGKVYLVSNRDVKLSNNSNIANSNISVGNILYTTDSSIKSSEVNVTKGAAISNSNIDNSKITTAKRFTLSNGSKLTNSTVDTTNSDIVIDAAIVDNSTITSKSHINVYNGSLISNSKLNSGVYLNLWDSSATSSQLNSTNTFNSTNSIVDNSTINSGNYLNIYNGSTLTSSTAKAAVNLNISDASQVSNCSLSAGNIASVYKKSNVTKSDIHAENYFKVADSTVTSSGIQAGNMTLDSNSKLSESWACVKNNINTNNSVVENSQLHAGGNINLTNNSKLLGSCACAKNDINLNSSTIDGSRIHAGGNINLANNSKLVNSEATTNHDLNLNHSQVESSLVYACNNISLENGSSFNKSEGHAHKNLNLTDSNVNSSIIYFDGKLHKTNSKVKNSWLIDLW